MTACAAGEMGWRLVDGRAKFLHGWFGAATRVADLPAGLQ
jgi:hypothetical protein